MAGDWIKMRVDLGDDPAVVQIACQLDISEDEVVGKLHRLWSWADKHTTDGTAPAITSRWVDRYVSRTGFADAMVGTGWLSFTESGVVFPSFDRHNGDSAKRRVEATLRQRLSRKNRDEGVTGEERTSIPRPFVRHVLQRDGYQCVFCGDQSDEKTEAGRKARLSIDHLKPISRGGSASVDNLACACRQCNGEKNDRTPEEWGLVPTFLQPGVFYTDGCLVTDMSQKQRDESVTREEKRREEEITPKGKNIRASRFDAQAHLESLDVDPAVARDWLAVRKAKKLPATPTAVEGVVGEAAKAGMSLETALRVCCTRGWGGFKAEWINESHLSARSPPASYHDERAETIAALTGRNRSHEPDDDRTIDVLALRVA